MNAFAPTVTAADRGFTWSDEETLILLRLWNNVFTLPEDSSGNKNNFFKYERISKEMNGLGYIRTTSQCKEKIKRMKREYTITKQRNLNSKKKKNMRFFEEFEETLLNIQNKNIEHSSPRLKKEETEKVSENQKERKWRNIAPKPESRNLRKRKEPVEISKETTNPWTPDVVLVEEEIQPIQPTPSKKSFSESVNSCANGEPTRKKRKLNSKLSNFKSIMDSLSLKFMKYQVESDEKMLKTLEDLEKERIAVDNRVQKMWMDFEERRKIDEKEHELNVMTTFQDIINSSKSSVSEPS